MQGEGLSIYVFIEVGAFYILDPPFVSRLHKVIVIFSTKIVQAIATLRVQRIFFYIFIRAHVLGFTVKALAQVDDIEAIPS
ncbi:hypothetical protein GDO81_019575 [Engystomops pustulosus]|uniref:Uncharacterized protein n=1 Tax=Engystomops pustulosus TaxID=76066 RepID=A0AAV6Z2W0_ENGPU|nr:hypothetical protein GDO81_019575 [Engystomops pustulosus]